MAQWRPSPFLLAALGAIIVFGLLVRFSGSSNSCAGGGSYCAHQPLQQDSRSPPPAVTVQLPHASVQALGLQPRDVPTSATALAGAAYAWRARGVAKPVVLFVQPATTLRRGVTDTMRHAASEWLSVVAGEQAASFCEVHFTNSSAFPADLTPHMVVIPGSVQREAAAEFLVDALIALAAGGVVVLDGLVGEEALAEGSVPVGIRRPRYDGTFIKYRGMASYGRDPLSYAQVMHDHLHTNGFFVGDEWRLPDPRAQAATAAVSSIDFWPDATFVWKAGLQEAPPLPAFVREAVSGNPTWVSLAQAQPNVPDKITIHHYGPAYERYLPFFAAAAKASGGRKVRLLEVGLGCGMPYGPGQSATTWRTYFGDSLELTMLEYDAPCAEAWAATRAGDAWLKTYAGDQADQALLARIIAERGPFDIVIDDGGHTMAQQVGCMQGFFPGGLTPGGIYVVEDLTTTHMGGAYLDSPEHAIGYLIDIADLMVSRPALPWAQQTWTNAPAGASGAPPAPALASTHGGHSAVPPQRGSRVPEVRPHGGYTAAQIVIAEGLAHMECIPELCVLVRR